MKKNQNGFITMIVIMLAIAGFIIWLAVNRVLDAQDAKNDVGGSSAVLES
jgi:hypothetical protein